MSTGRAQQSERIGALAAIDLRACEDDALFGHVAELKAFAIDSMKIPSIFSCRTRSVCTSWFRRANSCSAGIRATQCAS